MVLIKTVIFMQENVFENVACKMASILFWPQYVDDWETIVDGLSLLFLGP